MLKKYLLLGMVLLIPLFLINLNSTLNFEFRLRRAVSLPDNPTVELINESQASNIIYNSKSGARNLLIFFVILLNLIIFLELRNDKLGGFILSLPIKNEKLYFYIIFSGFLFILINFIMNLGVSYYSILKAKNNFIQTLAPSMISDFENKINLKVIEFIKNECLLHLSIFSFFCILTFVQTLFKKPIFAVCAAVGGVFAPMLWIEIIGSFKTALEVEHSDYAIYDMAGNLYMGLLGRSNRSNFSYYVLIAVLLLVIVVTYPLGKYLYKKTGQYWDSIFTFKIVKAIMAIGISVSTGCLFTFIYSSIYRGTQVSVLSMTIVLFLGLFIGFILPRKIFNVLA